MRKQGARYGMEIGVSMLLVVAAALEANGQTENGAASAVAGQLLVMPAGTSTSQTQGIAPLEIFRTIDDPHTGDRWLLIRDRTNPAGPGRLVLTSKLRDKNGQDGLNSRSIQSVTGTAPARVGPVIRTGDRVIVEENTAVIEAHLEAVALGPAAIGSAFNVRLKIGGKVASAVALGPGRAAFATEGRP